jgi:hypothetical protein
VTYTRSIMSTKRLRARLERILALVASNQMPVIVTQYLNITEFEYSFLGPVWQRADTGISQ